ncbi:hypothetical protein [Thalassiella azotivora]
MPDYSYEARLVLDQATGRPAAGVTGTLRATQGGPAVETWDPNDQPAPIVTSDHGIAYDWKADIPFGYLDFGSYGLFVTSMEHIGSVSDAQAAASSAAQSAQAAADAQAAAEAAAGAAAYIQLGTPTAGQALVWDDTEQKYVPGDVSGGGGGLSAAVSFPVVWDGTSWVADGVVVTEVQDLIDLGYPERSQAVFVSPGDVAPPAWAPDGTGYFAPSGWDRT